MRLAEKQAPARAYEGVRPYIALASPDPTVRRRLWAVLARYPRYEEAVLWMLRRPDDLNELDRAVLLFLDARCREEGLETGVSSIVEAVKRLSAGAAEEAAEALALRLCASRARDGSWSEHLNGLERDEALRRTPRARPAQRTVLRTTLAVYALEKWARYRGPSSNLEAMRAVRAGRRWLETRALPDLWAALEQGAGTDLNVPDSSFAFLASAYGRRTPPSVASTVRLLLRQLPDGAWPKSAMMSDRISPGSQPAGPDDSPGGDVGATALSVLSLALLQRWVAKEMSSGQTPAWLGRQLGLTGSSDWRDRNGRASDFHPYDAIVEAMVRGSGWLALQQLRHGGWPRCAGLRRPQGRIISTCLAISALIEARGTGAMPAVIRGLAYLASRSRGAEDGTVFWPSDWRRADQEGAIASTALAVGALVHVGLADTRALADRSVLWLVGRASETTSTATGARLLCSFTDYLNTVGAAQARAADAFSSART